jgi:hypothetical protein
MHISVRHICTAKAVFAATSVCTTSSSPRQNWVSRPLRREVLQIDQYQSRNMEPANVPMHGSSLVARVRESRCATLPPDRDRSDVNDAVCSYSSANASQQFPWLFIATQYYLHSLNDAQSWRTIQHSAITAVTVCPEA